MSGTGAGFGGDVSLSYDAVTGAYTVRDATGASTAFLPSTRSPADSNATVTAFSKANGARSDQLVLFNPGAANPRMALSYVSYGAWQQVTDVGGGALDVAHQYFVYGVRQSATAPSTGSASYTTIVDGIWANANGIYSLDGTSSFTANFNNLTVATTLDLVGENILTSQAKTLGRFTGGGSIAAMGGAFSGTLSHQGTDADGRVYTGSFAGAFFGPQGQEMGYSFSLTGAGAAAAGAVVGKAN